MNDWQLTAMCSGLHSMEMDAAAEKSSIGSKSDKVQNKNNYSWQINFASFYKIGDSCYSHEKYTAYMSELNSKRGWDACYGILRHLQNLPKEDGVISAPFRTLWKRHDSVFIIFDRGYAKNKDILHKACRENIQSSGMPIFQKPFYH